MSYPKPLSEKSISRQYTAAGLSDEQIEFVHRFFTACANLYGVFMAEDAWAVYQELSSKTTTVRLHRRDLYAALGVLRRETLPFYVFEADEVFSEEPRSDKYRVIALRDLVPPGYGRFFDLYRVMENSDGKPFYVPKDLLDYAVMPENKYETALLELLGGLRSTLSEYEDRWGHTHSCPYTGQYLRDFSYVSDSDAFELSRLRGEYKEWKGNAEKAAELEAQLYSVSAAQYLVDGLKWRSHIGFVTPAESTEYFLDDLTAMGVSFTGEKQINNLLRAVTDMGNHQHLWCNRGWTPRELHNQLSGQGKPSICFGPGMQAAFANGTMDKQEIVRKIQEMGLDVLE